MKRANHGTSLQAKEEERVSWEAPRSFFLVSEASRRQSIDPTHLAISCALDDRREYWFVTSDGPVNKQRNRVAKVEGELHNPRAAEERGLLDRDAG
jgi:hypothetical protein